MSQPASTASDKKRFFALLQEQGKKTKTAERIMDVLALVGTGLFVTGVTGGSLLLIAFGSYLATTFGGASFHNAGVGQGIRFLQKALNQENGIQTVEAREKKAKRTYAAMDKLGSNINKVGQLLLAGSLVAMAFGVTSPFIVPALAGGFTSWVVGAGITTQAARHGGLASILGAQGRMIAEKARYHDFYPRAEDKMAVEFQKKLDAIGSGDAPISSLRDKSAQADFNKQAEIQKPAPEQDNLPQNTQKKKSKNGKDDDFTFMA